MGLGDITRLQLQGTSRAAAGREHPEQLLAGLIPQPLTQRAGRKFLGIPVSAKKQVMETSTLTLGPGCPFSPLSPCKRRGGRGQQLSRTALILCTHTLKDCSEGQEAEEQL